MNGRNFLDQHVEDLLRETKYQQSTEMHACALSQNLLEGVMRVEGLGVLQTAEDCHVASLPFTTTVAAVSAAAQHAQGAGNVHHYAIFEPVVLAASAAIRPQGPHALRHVWRQTLLVNMCSHVHLEQQCAHPCEAHSIDGHGAVPCYHVSQSVLAPVSVEIQARFRCAVSAS